MYPFSTLSTLRAGLWLVLALGANAVWAQPPSSAWIDAGAYSEFHVVLPENAEDDMVAASEFFLRVWMASTQREIEASTVNQGIINVWLGDSAVQGGILSTQDWDALQQESALLRTYTPSRRYANQGARKQLIVASRTGRAAFYGITAFFEQQIGARFLEPGLEVIPLARFTMNELDYSYASPFAERDLAYHGLWPDGAREEHRKKMRLAREWRAEPYPLYNFHDILPPDRFPDFYEPLESDTHDLWWRDFPWAPGEMGRKLNRCLDDAALVEAVTEELLALWRDDSPRKARVFSGDDKPTISMVPMPWDMDSPCAETVPASEQLLTLLTALSRAFEEALPDQPFQFHVLAEGAFRAPPEAPLNIDDLIVQISTRDVDNSRSIRDAASEANTRFREDLEGWAATGATLAVLDYVGNVHNPLQAHPNFDTLQERFQYFDQHLISRVYAFALPGIATPLGEWDALRAYVVAKLLWDPDYPADLAVADYVAGAYGPAAPLMERFLRMTVRMRAESDAVLDAQTAPWWPVEWVEDSHALFEEAEALELSDDERLRLGRARISVNVAQALLPKEHPLHMEKAALRQRITDSAYPNAPGLERLLARMEQLLGP